MKTRLTQLAVRMLMPGLLLPIALAAQDVTLSGTVTDAKGNPIPKATVSLTQPYGSTLRVPTDANGKYTISPLSPGNYIIEAFGNGLSAKPVALTITAAPQQTEDLLLVPGPDQQPPNAPSPAQSAPPTQPSLEDLGFSKQQTQGNTQLQATLQTRTRMLKIHQKLGLFTTIPMAAAVITGPMAKAKGRNGGTIRVPTDANLDFHAALGGLTTAMYFTTAYYSIFAPRVPNNPKHGGIRWHEALAFVHAPGMVLTPVLGIMAYNQENSGKKPTGIAAQHGTVAYITSIAYGASIVAVSWPIHWKFWESK